MRNDFWTYPHAKKARGVWRLWFLPSAALNCNTLSQAERPYYFGFNRMIRRQFKQLMPNLLDAFYDSFYLKPRPPIEFPDGIDEETKRTLRIIAGEIGDD